MRRPAAPVTVTAISEHPDLPQDWDRALVIMAGPAIIGTAARDGGGWTASVRAGLFRRRVTCTSHDDAHAAVGQILGSRMAGSLGITAWSSVRWSDEAETAARDTPETPPPVPVFTPMPGITEIDEAEIAVGSLSGIAPSDIHSHVLLVLDHAGGLGISTSACDASVAVIVTSAASILAKRAASSHVHDHGGQS